MSPKATVHSVQIREAKVTGAQRVADGRIVEMKSENDDDVEVESLPASALPEANVVVDRGNDAPTPPTEPTEQGDPEQPSQIATTSVAVVDIVDKAEDPPVPPTPASTNAVSVAAA
ncbi:hypothetical protein GGI08_002409 [Coemansia sp. S2]|nr:hypothetical protein GGI08_002409 [Coemansia sp. S2]KAJ2070322.1 hypothetical protein GGH13_004111 [Coemansia sp. S155-1]